jgi:flagella basal body P-ring formation protein FlgA
MQLENQAQQIHLPAEIDPTLSVNRINFDRRSNRFSATMVAAAGDPQAFRFTISGKLYQMVEIPVVTHRVRRGDVIDRSEVETILVRADQVSSDIVISSKELIGKAPKRTLIENRPIRVNEVHEPILVKRGGIVTMIYQTRFMRISARGIAKTNGAAGDTVRIENSGSKKMVQGVVTGPGEVTVHLSRPVAMK